MKKQIVLLLTTMLAATSSVGAYAGCSNKTIQGQYAAVGTIGARSGNNFATLNAQARFVFDGQGRVNVYNGNAGAFGVDTTFSGNGRYNLNGACVGGANIALTTKGSPPGSMRLELLVSGTPADPKISAFYRDTEDHTETGQFVMSRIGF